MSRKYVRQLQVVWAHSYDGGRTYYVGLRYGQMTIGGIKYIRDTPRNHKHQILWPKYGCPDCKRAILPGKGFSANAIKAIEDHLAANADVHGALLENEPLEENFDLEPAPVG